jgi:preprotein translocase subunit SecE
MSRVTEFPDEEGREGPSREAAADDEAGERVLPRAPKIALVARVGDFYQDVKQEMRKTSWPTRSQVTSTTVVVIIAVFFFGFYLFGVDWVVTQGFLYLEKIFGG